MGTLADRVGLPQPLGELVIEFGRGHDSEVMHEEAPRVRTGTSDARVLDATLEVEKAVERGLLGGQASESAAAPLQADRRLRDRVAEWATCLGELDEAAVESDDLLGLVVQVSLDRPFVGHGAEAISLGTGKESLPLGEWFKNVPLSRSQRTSAERMARAHSSGD